MEDHHHVRLPARIAIGAADHPIIWEQETRRRPRRRACLRRRREEVALKAASPVPTASLIQFMPSSHVATRLSWETVTSLFQGSVPVIGPVPIPLLCMPSKNGAPALERGAAIDALRHRLEGEADDALLVRRAEQEAGVAAGTLPLKLYRHCSSPVTIFEVTGPGLAASVER